MTEPKSLRQQRLEFGAPKSLVGRALGLRPFDISFAEQHEEGQSLVPSRIRRLLETWAKEGRPALSAADENDWAREVRDREMAEANTAEAQARQARMDERRAKVDEAAKARTEAWQRHTDARIALAREIVAELGDVRGRMNVSQTEMSRLLGEPYNLIHRAESGSGGGLGTDRLKHLLDRYRAFERVAPPSTMSRG